MNFGEEYFLWENGTAETVKQASPDVVIPVQMHPLQISLCSGKMVLGFNTSLNNAIKIMFNSVLIFQLKGCCHVQPSLQFASF